MPNNNHNQTPFFQTGLPQTTDQDNTYPGELGIRFTFEDPQDSNIAKRYQYVKRDDSNMATAPTAGAIAFWKNVSGYVVTTLATNRGRVAGIFLNAPSANNCCCIQIGGPCDVQFDAGTPSALGLIAIPSATTGQATANAAGTAATYPALGITLSTTSAGKARVELQLPGRE